MPAGPRQSIAPQGQRARRNADRELSNAEVVNVTGGGTHGCRRPCPCTGRRCGLRQGDDRRDDLGFGRGRSHVEDIILKEGYGCDTEVVPGDTVPTVTSMTEKGEPDIAPEVWINSAREVVEAAVAEGRLTIAGDIFSDGGEEGWWVPTFVVEQNPELTTLQEVIKRPDLFPDKEEPGKGRFYGCPPGWACEIVNRNLYMAYGLDEAGFTLFNPGSAKGWRVLSPAPMSAATRSSPIIGRRPRCSATTRW